TVEAVDQALQGLRLPPGSDILLSPLRENDGNWFVEDFIARRLNDAGYSVHVEPAPGSVATPPSGTTPEAPTPSGPAPSRLAAAMKHTSGKADTTADSTKKVATSPDSAAGGPKPHRPHPNAAGAGNATPPNPAGAVDEGRMIPVPEGRGLVFTYRL